MQNKKLILIMGVLVLLVGAAAFVAGRMFNGNVGIVSLGGPDDGRVSISLSDIAPAPELPTIPSELTGMFVERGDDTLIVRAFSFDPGIGGMTGDTPMDTESGPTVEIFVTNATTIYRETTEFSRPVAGVDFSIQQTVEESTLDHLNEPTTIIVWGRRSGDRVIADVLFYSKPSMLKKP